MKDVLKRGNIISKIRDGIDLDEIADYAKNQVFSNGPVDTVVLEILSYFKLFQPNYFENFELEIIEIMGLFYKNPEPDTLQGVVFDMYSQYIRNTYGNNYTCLLYTSEMGNVNLVEYGDIIVFNSNEEV